MPKKIVTGSRAIINPAYAASTIEKIIDARLDEIRDLSESGISEMTGKGRREYVNVDDPHDQGKIVGRFGGLNIPELQKAGVSPKQAAAAIRRAKGRVFDRIRRAVRSGLDKAGYTVARRSEGAKVVPPHPGNRKCAHCVDAHSRSQHRFHGPGSFQNTHLFSFNPDMKIKENLPTRAQARQFLHEGRLNRRPLTAAQRRLFAVIARGGKPRRLKNVRNPYRGPRAVEMYARVGGFWAQKGPGHPCDQECKDADHWYEHVFTKKFPMIGLPKGAVVKMDTNRILI